MAKKKLTAGQLLAKRRWPGMNKAQRSEAMKALNAMRHASLTPAERAAIAKKAGSAPKKERADKGKPRKTYAGKPVARK